MTKKMKTLKKSVCILNYIGEIKKLSEELLLGVWLHQVI